MISPEDLKLGRLAVSLGLIAPGDLGRASEIAARGDCSLGEAFAQLGLLPTGGLGALEERKPSVDFLISGEVHAPAAAGARAAPATLSGGGAIPTPRDPKYEIWGEIAQGGMGRIYLAYDRDIHRKVAMKVMRAGAPESAGRIKRFIEEIQATGQLEHPSIVPIYDMGFLDDGEPYFTMRYVKGRSLEEILDELRAGHDLRGEFGRVRLLSILHQVCMAAHFAHEKGVIHRDLKPGNVMLGSYGEVQIMDWGLAKVRGRQDLHDDPAAVEVTSPSEHPATLAGQVIGTPVYMSPEQAAGNAWNVEATSDVYSLGAILYALLTYHPPFSGTSTVEILEQVRAGELVPPRQRAPQREIPESLEDICLHAMARDPAQRHQSARSLADDITHYLEGHRERERNHALADRHYAEGMRLAVRYSALSLSLSDLEESADRARRSVKDWWPFEQRRHVWEARRLVVEAADEAASTFNAATEQLYRALRYEQEHAGARAALADLYWERFQKAEASGDRADQIMYRGLVERHDDGRHAALLIGDGLLDLASTPEVSEVFLTPFEEEGPLLQLGDEHHLGSTPIRALQLAMGSYLLRLVSRGRRDALVPVRVDRAAQLRLHVRLHAEAGIVPGFVQVPAGPVALGGDPEAQSPRDRFVSNRPELFMGRHPVTVSEYREFISALAAGGRLEEALHRVPRESSETGAYWHVDAGGEVTLADPAAGHDFVWSDRLPVSCVSWEDAMAYCDWRSGQLGRVVSLPHDEDWEKAARGADGRFFPWGNHHDYTFANNAHSHEGGGRLVPVGTFPMDRSPYGVCDMAGNVRELCRNSPAPNYPHAAVIRGGGYNSPSLDVRNAGRAMVLKKDVRKLIGFRVAIYPDGIPAGEEAIPADAPPESPGAEGGRA